MLSRNINTHKGFTLVEATIILLLLVILGAILLPVVERFIDLSRIVRAREDMTVIAASMVLALQDMQMPYFYVDGNGPAEGFDIGTPNPSSQNRVTMLVSDGSIPNLDVPSGSISWVMPILPPDDFFSCNVDLIANHLVTNSPFNDSNKRYLTLSELGSHLSGWRGAYLTAPVSSDPWGSRYAINVEWLDPNHLPSLPVVLGDVLILCAGPDQTVQSAYTGVGLTPGGDDQMLTLKGGRMQ